MPIKLVSYLNQYARFDDKWGFSSAEHRINTLQFLDQGVNINLNARTAALVFVRKFLRGYIVKVAKGDDQEEQFVFKDQITADNKTIAEYLEYLILAKHPLEIVTRLYMFFLVVFRDFKLVSSLVPDVGYFVSLNGDNCTQASLNHLAEYVERLHGSFSASGTVAQADEKELVAKGLQGVVSCFDAAAASLLGVNQAFDFSGIRIFFEGVETLDGIIQACDQAIEQVELHLQRLMDEKSSLRLIHEDLIPEMEGEQRGALVAHLQPLAETYRFLMSDEGIGEAQREKIGTDLKDVEIQLAQAKAEASKPQTDLAQKLSEPSEMIKAFSGLSSALGRLQKETFQLQRDFNKVPPEVLEIQCWQEMLNNFEVEQPFLLKKLLATKNCFFPYQDDTTHMAEPGDYSHPDIIFEL